MECTHAYIRKRVNYILCDCEGKIESEDMKEIAPKLCLHQRYCPKVGTCALLPTWRQCNKIKTRNGIQE